MPQNAIQFQKGLSELAFAALYGTEALCSAAVERMRWPDGFVCPHCGHDDAHRLERRGLFQCALCRKQVSMTAGVSSHRGFIPNSSELSDRCRPAFSRRLTLSADRYERRRH